MPWNSLRVCAVAAVLMSIAVPGICAQAPHTERAAAAAVRVSPGGTVSVRADGVPVQSLLEALQPVCPMDVRLDPKVAARSVSIDVEDLSPAAAVGAVLKASGLDFAMHTRCGTLEKPALVVVREGGNGPIPQPAPRVDPDDPRVKRVAVDEEPPLPSEGPPPEPEKRDDPAAPPPITIIGGASEQRELAAGEVTGKQMLEQLAPQPRSNSAVIELPFTDQNGQPYLQIRPPKSSTVVLPFPDANGNLVEVPMPAQTGPRPQRADFPVYQPPPAGAAGSKTGSPSPGPVNPADGKRPGGGGSER
jgi:hypothetical protein